MALKKGNVINGYRILDDPTTEANCKWSFAEKFGVQYFIKEYTYYKYTDYGDAEDIKKTKKICDEYFERSRNLMRLLNRKSPPGGNLNVTIDFFRDGNKLYKVTEKINNPKRELTEISSQKIGYRLLFLRTLTHCVKLLHDEKIVHGDLKPENILLRLTSNKLLVANLIDFDDSYFSGEPPTPEKTIGDARYHSPELLDYYKGITRPNGLTTQSDIFALGILFYQYVTGNFPSINPKYHYICEAVNNNDQVILKPYGAQDWIISMIDLMLRKSPQDRPDITQVQVMLDNMSVSKVDFIRTSGLLKGNLVVKN